MVFQIINKSPVKKCLVCGTDISKRYSSAKYCVVCRYAVDNYKALECNKRMAKERKEVWSSLSKDKQLELMEKVAKRFLEKK